MSENTIPLYVSINKEQRSHEYLIFKKGEIKPKELKVLNQYIKEVMNPEGLEDFKYFLDTLLHVRLNAEDLEKPFNIPILSQEVQEQNNHLFKLAMANIKGIYYEQDKSKNLTFFAKIKYAEGGEEVLRPYLEDRNLIPMALHLCRTNLVSRLRYELSKNREADKRHEQKKNHLRLSNTFVTSVSPKPIVKVLNIQDQDLPEGVKIDPIQYKNRLGGDIQLTGYQHDLFIALLELNHKKSETQDSTDPSYYLGNYNEGLQEYEEVKNDKTNKIERIATPYFTTSYHEIATQLNGGKKPSTTEKEKAMDTLWDLIEKPDLWPTISFKIGKDKYKLNKALLEIIEHENKKDIIIRLNPAVSHDITKRWFELPPNFTARRIEISTKLNKKRPDFLTPLVYYITELKNNPLQKDEQGRPYWESGLLQIKNGDPGIFYRFGYSRNEEQRNQKRFLERWAIAIEYLKEFELIEDYSERVTTWGNKVGRFTFKANEKKKVN